MASFEQNLNDYSEDEFSTKKYNFIFFVKKGSYVSLPDFIQLTRSIREECEGAEENKQNGKGDIGHFGIK